MNGELEGGIVLNRGGQVPLTEHRILLPAIVQVFNGGMNMEGCDMALRIIDVPRTCAYWVPLPDKLASSIAHDIDNIRESRY